MSIKQFQQELSKGMQYPVYLLHSNEDFLLYDALCSIKAANCDVDAFNFNIFDMKSSDDSKSIDQMIDILNTLPFLIERRILIIENIQKLTKKDIKKLEGYIQSPSKTSLLVMLYNGQSPKLFDAAVLKNIKVIPLVLQERDIPFWIKTKAKKRGVDITDRAIEHLIGIVGADIGLLHAEIEKLLSFNNAVIDIDDIKEIVCDCAEYNAFDLIKALKKKDARDLFRILENTGKNMEPQMLLGALNWQYARFPDLPETFKMLHEADVLIKKSHSFVIDDLIIKLRSRYARYKQQS